MHNQHNAKPLDHGSGEARTHETVRQLEALEAIARKTTGKSWISIDRTELLDMLHAATATTGGGW